MFHKQAIVLLDLTKFYKNKLTDPESLRKLCKKKKKKNQNCLCFIQATACTRLKSQGTTLPFLFQIIHPLPHNCCKRVDLIYSNHTLTTS